MHMSAWLPRQIEQLLFYSYTQKTNSCYPAKYLQIAAVLADSKSQQKALRVRYCYVYFGWKKLTVEL